MKRSQSRVAASAHAMASRGIAWPNEIVAGLRYAFPRAMAGLEKRHPRIAALHDKVAARPRIAAYLASDRRIAFNQQGIFRHYPELDTGG